MTPLAVLAIGIALAFAALSGYLVWRLDIQTRRGDREASRAKAEAAKRKQLGQIARKKEAECMQLAALVREGEAAYAQLQESIAVGGWVKVPTNEELEAGSWN